MTVKDQLKAAIDGVFKGNRSGADAADICAVMHEIINENCTTEEANAIADAMQTSINNMGVDLTAINNAIAARTRFQKDGVYQNNIKIGWGSATANGSGLVTIYITDTNLQSGAALLTDIFAVIPSPAFNADTPISFGAVTVAGDKKSVSFAAKKASSTFVSLLGITIALPPVAASGAVVGAIIIGV